MDPMKTTDASGGVSLAELHAANIARQTEWCPDQLPDLSFRGNELAGETGEACNVIKKLERERHGWRGSRATKEQLAEELADVVICADLCAVTAGIDLDAAVRDKFNATSEKVGLTTKLAALASAPPATTPDAGNDLARLSASAGGIYLASKTAHAPRWRSMRENGLPIISTWIDEAGKGETACFTDLWRRCVSEAAGARAVIVYREPGEVLKGAFVEAGAALATGVPVFAIGCDELSFVNHAGVTRCATIEHALNCALGLPPASASPPPAEDLAGQGEPVAWALELAASFELSGKSLFFPEQFADGYSLGWDAAHRECAKDLRHAAKYSPTSAPAPSRPADREEIARALCRHQIAVNRSLWGRDEPIADESLRRAEDNGWRQWAGFADAILECPTHSDREGKGGERA